MSGDSDRLDSLVPRSIRVSLGSHEDVEALRSAHETLTRWLHDPRAIERVRKEMPSGTRKRTVEREVRAAMRTIDRIANALTADARERVGASQRIAGEAE